MISDESVGFAVEHVIETKIRLNIHYIYTQLISMKAKYRLKVAAVGTAAERGVALWSVE